jgi:hypothetical protein
MKTDHFKNVYEMVENIPVISSHEHHLPDDLQEVMNLDRTLEQSYIGWFAGRKDGDSTNSGLNDLLTRRRRQVKMYDLPDDDWSKDPVELANERQQFLDRFGFNSYWVWLDNGIQKIYGLPEGITPENWEDVSARIAHNHARPGAHLDMMRDHGGYLRAVQDTYWDYSSDLGHPEFFSPTMRLDMFITCYNSTVLDHDKNNPFISYPDVPRENFDDYLDFLKSLIFSWREKGAVAMKCASAYERPLTFKETDRKTAAEIFGQPEEKVSPQDRIAYGNFIFHWFCELNRQMDIPFQIHTGLAEISGSEPMLFEPVIRNYPDIQFVLFHAGYPWYTQIAGLAHNYPNVVIDMVWAPIISTSASIQALKEYIEVAPSSDLIGWGGDTWTSEEAVGAVLAWKYVIAKVLAEMIESGYLSTKKAEILAEKLLYKNNAGIYGIAAP